MDTTEINCDGFDLLHRPSGQMCAEEKGSNANLHGGSLVDRELPGRNSDNVEVCLTITEEPGRQSDAAMDVGVLFVESPGTGTTNRRHAY